MDATSIERMAKAAVEEYFCINGYVRPYINENDKMPIWDGNLLVYRDKEKLTNDNLLYPIPVQLKGECFKKDDFPEKTYYQLNKTNLEHYLRDNGVLFIKVLIKGTEKRIYINFLTKLKLKRLSENMKGKSCSVKLEPLNDNVSYFLENANSFHLQKTKSSISPLDLKDKTFNIKCHAARFKDEPVLAFIARNIKHLTVSVDGMDTEFYLECEEANICTRKDENTPVYVNGVKYYDKIVRTYDKDRTCTLYIGESLQLQINPARKNVNIECTVNIQANSFTELLNELRFLSALVKHKTLTIFDSTIDLSNIDETNPICQQLNRMYKEWEDVETLFNILHVYETLDINLLKDEDYAKLHKLTQAILYNKRIETNVKQDHLELISIGNINIILLVKIIDKNNCKLLSLQNELVAVSAERNGVVYPLPVFSKIFREELLQSNIDFTNMIDEYESFIDKNPYLHEVVNEDVLCLLKHYDKKGNEFILSKAIELAEWQLNIGLDKKSENIYILNLLQAKLRKLKKLNNQEIEALYQITENDASDENRWAACILLKDYRRAGIYWEKIHNADKGIYKQFPIFNLIPKDETYRFEITD